MRVCLSILQNSLRTITNCPCLHLYEQKIFCGLAFLSTMDEAKWCFGPIYPLHLPHRFYYNSVMKMWVSLKIVSSLSSLVIVVFLNLTLDLLTLLQCQDFPLPCRGQVPSTGSWILNCLNTACRTFWTVIIPVVACKSPENTSPNTTSAWHILLRGLIMFCNRNTTKSL